LAKIYTNENFPFPIVLELRRLGHDVLTSRDAGNDGRSVPDGEVLDYAISSGRVLQSRNLVDARVRAATDPRRLSSSIGGQRRRYFLPFTFYWPLP
jgi:hypothetical protein